MNEFSNLREKYVVAITEEIAKELSKKNHISTSEATKEFKASGTYKYLAYEDVEFWDEGPEFFLDLYNNEKKLGRVVSSEELYLEKHPELWIKRV